MALSDLRAAKTLSELNLSVTADQIEALRKNDRNGAVVEEYLALLSAKMDIGDSLDALCSTRCLLLQFILLINDYSRCHEILLSDPTHNVSMTHRSYEYVLFILLGIAEKATTLRSVVNQIEQDERVNLATFFHSLGRIISSDTFYFTQEMALEVLGRICFMFLSGQDKERVQDLIRPLSPLIKIHLNDKKAISTLLRDMRPLLNKLNESNVNIITFPVAAIALGRDSIAGSSWFDIAKTEMFCFYSDKFEIYLKFPFSLVESCVHSLPLVLEIKVSDIPEMYQSVFPGSSIEQLLRITFMDEEDVRESIKYFQRPDLAPKREEEIISSLSSPEMFSEEQILRGPKISITKASRREAINRMNALLKLADPVLTISSLPKSPQTPPLSPNTTKSTASSVKKVPGKSGRGRKRKAVNKKPVQRQKATATVIKKKEEVASLPEDIAVLNKLSFQEEDKAAFKSPHGEIPSKANTTFSGIKRKYGESSKRIDEPSITASFPYLRSAKMRPTDTDTDRKLPLGNPTFYEKFEFNIQGQENELKKPCRQKKTGKQAEEDTVAIKKRKLERSKKYEPSTIEENAFDHIPEIANNSIIVDVPSSNRFARGESRGELFQPASEKKLLKDDDTASRQSSTFLGKRKYGTANSTPRKPFPTADSGTSTAQQQTGTIFMQPKLPSWKKEANLPSATKTPEPGKSMAREVKRKSSKIPAAPSPITAILADNKSSFQENKYSAMAEDARKWTPLQEMVRKNTPFMTANIEKEDVPPIPMHSGLNLGRQQPQLAQQDNNKVDMEKKAKRNNQREALLTLSQQIEAMAPDLNDANDYYVDDGYVDNAAANNETVSATSFADESSAALSRILQELQAFQKPSPKGGSASNSKRRKQLRNIATSSQDQLHSYIHQVQHYLAYCLKDINHSLRTNHDTLSYSLSVTIQPQILAQEMKYLTDFEQGALVQYQDLFTRFSALKHNVQDVCTQEHDAAVSFRRSLTQTRQACRNRAVVKLRNAPSGPVHSNQKNSNKRIPTAADLRSIVSGGREIDIAAFLRG